MKEVGRACTWDLAVRWCWSPHCQRDKCRVYNVGGNYYTFPPLRLQFLEFLLGSPGSLAKAIKGPPTLRELGTLGGVCALKVAKPPMPHRVYTGAALLGMSSRSPCYPKPCSCPSTTVKVQVLHLLALQLEKSLPPGLTTTSPRQPYAHGYYLTSTSLVLSYSVSYHNFHGFKGGLGMAQDAAWCAIGHITRKKSTLATPPTKQTHIRGAAVGACGRIAALGVLKFSPHSRRRLEACSTASMAAT